MIGPINSFGGPYLVLPKSNASEWPGATNEAAYEGVCDAAEDDGTLMQVLDIQVLVLGTPDNLYYAAHDSGGVLARVVCFSARDNELLAKLLAELPSSGWTELGTLTVPGSLLAFDAGMAGSEALAEGLLLELAAGDYQVSHTTFMPDDETELMLTRLQRV